MDFARRTPAAPPQTPGISVEWEEVDCLLCGSSRNVPIIESPDSIPGGSGLWFAVVQCQDCGLCYTNPRPSERCIRQFYPPDYRPHLTPTASPRRRFDWSRLFGRGESDAFPAPASGGGNLLDFGCGGGRFLLRMHRLGWQVLGLDISEEAVRRVRGELDLPAIVGSLPHPALKPGTFDLITMRQSLEHVHDPLTLLRHANSLLAPAGRLVVMTPNIDSLPYRWFGQAWNGLDLPRHLTHFSPFTLYLMLDRAGFRMGPIRMVRHAEWLRSSAELASRDRKAPRWYRWLRSKSASRLASWCCALLEQADCMAVTVEKKEPVAEKALIGE